MAVQILFNTHNFSSLHGLHSKMCQTVTIIQIKPLDWSGKVYLFDLHASVLIRYKVYR
jgi:hypothetical protein